jgi:hypothetical protein
MDLPLKVAQAPIEGSLPQKVAELDQELDAPEMYPYLISFARYNDKMCQIPLLTKNKSRKIVEVLKKIGTKIYCKADFQRENIDQIPVRKDGVYKKLYNRLKEDIELKEIKLNQGSRIFYFDVESDKVFYVVAIMENHLETNKIRR